MKKPGYGWGTWRPHWPVRRFWLVLLSILESVAGVSLVLIGVGLVYVPAAIIMAGCALLAAVWFTNIES